MLAQLMPPHNRTRLTPPTRARYDTPVSHPARARCSPSQGHGLVNGVGLLAGGIVGGVGALIACPTMGAKHGVKGFAKGLGMCLQCCPVFF
jgi:hypothetical protein